MYTSDYKLYTVPGSTNWDYFKYGDGIWRKLYEEKLEHNEEFYKDMMANALASHSSPNLIDWTLDDGKVANFAPYLNIAFHPKVKACEILVIPGKYALSPYAFGYQKDSPYAEIFDYHIERMRATGVLDKIKTKYAPSPQECPDLT